MNKISFKRFIMVIISTIIMSLGIMLFIKSDMGTDPFSGLNIALTSILNIGYGTTFLLVNIILLGIVLILHRRLIHIGTLINMTGLGYCVDFLSYLFDTYMPPVDNIFLKIVLMILGVLILSFGVSIYFTSDLGVSPYDSMGFIIEKYSHLTFFWSRMISDFSCVTLTLILGGEIGVGTVICAFCLGPFISFFNKYVSEKIICKKLNAAV